MTYAFPHSTFGKEFFDQKVNTCGSSSTYLRGLALCGISTFAKTEKPLLEGSDFEPLEDIQNGFTAALKAPS
jgi:hypothetical protein